MSFATNKFRKPERWLNLQDRDFILEGRDDSIRDVDLGDEFGVEEPAWMMHKAQYKDTGPEEVEDFLEEDMDEDGELYNIEIGEEINWSHGSAFGEQAENYDLDSGLFSVHFTGYRDSSGNDYIVHCDPKVWDPEEGKQKFTGEPPTLPLADEGFQDDSVYSMEEGLKQLEEYVKGVKNSGERETWKNRWDGVQNAVETFRESYEEGNIYNDR